MDPSDPQVRRRSTRIAEVKLKHRRPSHARGRATRGGDAEQADLDVECYVRYRRHDRVQAEEPEAVADLVPDADMGVGRRIVGRAETTTRSRRTVRVNALPRAGSRRGR